MLNVLSPSVFFNWSLICCELLVLLEDLFHVRVDQLIILKLWWVCISFLANWMCMLIQLSWSRTFVLIEVASATCCFSAHYLIPLRQLQMNHGKFSCAYMVQSCRWWVCRVLWEWVSFCSLILICLEILICDMLQVCAALSFWECVLVVVG